MARAAMSGRKRSLWIVGTVLAMTAIVAALILQPWLLLIDVRVSDDIPAVAASSAPPRADANAGVEVDTERSATPLPPAGPIDLYRGTFVSHEHATTGSVRVIQHPDGSRQLAIEGLETTNGPDVHVWLSAAPVIEGFDGWFTAAGYDYVDLGQIKGNLGDQIYDIPADVDLAVLPTVELWCVQFSVSFGAAALS